ncbi:MAG: glutamate mutase L [Anaerolineales bacterium]
MSLSLVKSESLLAIDVGTVNTRVSLFDVVDARYRYLGSGIAPTTINAPYNDIREGINQAIEKLQTITGRVLLGDDAQIIIPEQIDGSGVDLVAATVSASAPLQVIVAGLLEDISVESAVRLANSIPSVIQKKFGLNDHLTAEERLNSIVQLRPDLILVAGGTDQGAERSVLKMLETIGLASFLLPDDQRPLILFIGNAKLHEKIKQIPIIGATIRFSPNIRPAIDTEQMQPARVELGDAFRRIQQNQLPGFSNLLEWTKGAIIPASYGWERVIRLLSKVYDSHKGVLGVDIGVSGICLAAGFGGETQVAVFPEYGSGSPYSSQFDSTFINEIQKWLMFDFSAAEIHNLIQTRRIYPASLPLTDSELDFEYAYSTVALQNSLQRFLHNLRSITHVGESACLPAVEPVIASGSILTNSSHLARSTMTILNGLQPTRITTLILDQHHLIKVLGAAAAINPVLAIQAMDFGTLLNLASVISPLGKAKPGTVILKAKINYEDGREQKMDIRYGQFICLPLAIGQSMQMQLQPLHKFDIGMGGEGVGGKVRLNGSALGVIIDARGRPLRLPQDREKRVELHKRWLLALEKR